MIRVDIVSDVVCPWCVIGYRQLVAAAEGLAIELDVHWHPFELHPGMPEEGQNLREHMAMKYGTTPEASEKARARLSAIGEGLGFQFKYTEDTSMSNTFRAHQLLDWANEQGREHDLKLALFEAFFTHQRNVSDIDVLTSVAEDVGLDPDEARRVLETEERAKNVRARQNVWLERYIQGVPAMVFNEKKLVTGAQGIERYTALLDQFNG